MLDRETHPRGTDRYHGTPERGHPMTAAHDALTAALVAALDADERPPCAWPDRGHLWLSEDHRKRRQAATECHGCILLDPCRAAAENLDAYGAARFGVWGGADFTNRPGHRRTPPKEAAA